MYKELIIKETIILKNAENCGMDWMNNIFFLRENEFKLKVNVFAYVCTYISNNTNVVSITCIYDFTAYTL